MYHRPDHPQTDFKYARAGNRIAIGLTARDNHWAQYSFQFAHEFCHALANYSNSSRPTSALSPPCQSLAGRESVRNSFVVCFASDGSLLADRSSVSGLAGLRCVAQLLCGGAIRTAKDIIFRRNVSSQFGSAQNQSALASQTPPSVLAIRSSRPNFCRFLKQNHAAGKRWRFSTALPLIRRARWRSILPNGVRDVRKGCDHSLSRSRQCFCDRCCR